MSALLTKHEVKMAGYWPSSLLWTETKTKKKRSQYQAILTEQVNKGFITWPKDYTK